MKKNLRMRSARIVRMRRWWRSIGVPSQLAIIGLALAGLGLVPAYLALFDNGGPERSSAAAPPGVTNSSILKPGGQAAPLRLDGTYNRTRESLMWAVPRTLPAEDDAVILTPNLIGNDPAQNEISALLLKRDGVKIEADETEDFRPRQGPSVQGQDGDRPFRTTAFAASYETIYNFDFFKGRFVKLPPGSKFPPPESGP